MPWRKEETMTLDAKERGMAREWAWPASLGAWLGRRTLADLVLEAVQRVDGEELNPPVTNAVDDAFHPKAILAMLTYCYADGVYGSQDAEIMMREDAAFRALCGNAIPDWHQLRRFRRYNNGMLRQTLMETFRRAWGFTGHARPTDVPRESNRPGEMTGLTPEQQARIQQEIDERIERAMFIDRMAMDF